MEFTELYEITVIFAYAFVWAFAFVLRPFNARTTIYKITAAFLGIGLFPRVLDSIIHQVSISIWLFYLRTRLDMLCEFAHMYIYKMIYTIPLFLLMTTVMAHMVSIMRLTYLRLYTTRATREVRKDIIQQEIKKQVAKAVDETLPPVQSAFGPEKMLPGSMFEKAVMPKFQCEIHGSRGGSEFHVRGQGFRTETGICTAAHVVSDLDEIKIVVGDKFVILPKNEETEDDFLQLEGDLMMIFLEDKHFGILGMTKPKLSALAVTEGSGLMAQVVACGQRSMGFLTPLEDKFGYIEYQGSTVGGFSGAPYYVNNIVFGMHLGGHVANIGYDAAYLRSLLNPSKRTIKEDGLAYVGEDSEEWLNEQIERSENFQWSQSPFSPDEYRVKINSQYYFVDDDVFGRMYGRHKGKSHKMSNKFEDLDPEACEEPETPAPKTYVSTYHYDPLRKVGSLTRDKNVTVEELPLAPRNAMSFDDSGNLIRAPHVVVGAHGQAREESDVQNLNPQTSNVMACKCQTPLDHYHMESRTSTRAPLRGASVPIQVSRAAKTSQKRKTKYQKMKSEIEQLKQRFQATAIGELTE